MFPRSPNIAHLDHNPFILHQYTDFNDNHFFASFIVLKLILFGVCVCVLLGFVVVVVGFLGFLVFVFVWSHLLHVEVPRSGTEPPPTAATQAAAGTMRVSNPLSHKRTILILHPFTVTIIEFKAGKV